VVRLLLGMALEKFIESHNTTIEEMKANGEV